MKKLITLISLLFIIGTFSLPANAQCSMCRRIAESNVDKDKQNFGKGLNKGILYLLSIPYILGGVAGFMWYRSKKRS